MKKFVKRIAALAAAGCLTISSALALDVDFKALTSEELLSLISGARNEIAMRDDVYTQNNLPVIYDDGTIKFYIKSIDSMQIENSYVSGDRYKIRMTSVFINNSENDIMTYAGDAYVDGWLCDAQFIQTVEAGKKAKIEIVITADPADIEDMEHPGDVEFITYMYGHDAIKTVIQMP